MADQPEIIRAVPPTDDSIKSGFAGAGHLLAELFLREIDATRKAVTFFERHGNTTALRHGTAGVKAYVRQVLAALSK